MDKQKAIELIEEKKKVLKGMSNEEKVVVVALVLMTAVGAIVGWALLRLIL